MVCEACQKLATRSDDAGTPLCDACFAAVAKSHPMYEEGYEHGFADALNDVAEDLMAAARAVLVARDKRAFDQLRTALAACKRRAA